MRDLGSSSELLKVTELWWTQREVMNVWISLKHPIECSGDSNNVFLISFNKANEMAEKIVVRGNHFQCKLTLVETVYHFTLLQYQEKKSSDCGKPETHLSTSHAKTELHSWSQRYLNQRECFTGYDSIPWQIFTAVLIAEVLRIYLEGISRVSWEEDTQGSRGYCHCSWSHDTLSSQTITEFELLWEATKLMNSTNSLDTSHLARATAYPTTWRRNSGNLASQLC